MRKQLAVGEVEHRVDVFDVVLGKDIVLFRERRLHRFRSCRHRRTCIRALQLHQLRVQNVIHGEEDGVQRFLLVLLLNQVVNVRDADLGREAGVNRATAGTRAIEFLAGVIGVYDVLGFDSEAFEIGIEQRRVAVDV